MKRNSIQCALIAATMLLSASLSLAADNKATSVRETKATGNAQTIKSQADKSTKAKASAKVKLVDINGASKSELQKLPGIKDAEAKKIIAGRPYLSKADLVTQNILPPNIYGGIKGLVVAKPNEATEAKLERLLKNRASK